MAWNGYIDSVMAGCNAGCDKVALIGLQGGGIWTNGDHASHWAISAQEATLIASNLATDNYTSFQASGIMIGGTKYMFLRKDEDEGLVLGKKKEDGAVTVQKSGTAVIIAHCKEGSPHADVNKGVQLIIDYLKGVNS